MARSKATKVSSKARVSKPKAGADEKRYKTARVQRSKNACHNGNQGAPHQAGARAFYEPQSPMYNPTSPTMYKPTSPMYNPHSSAYFRDNAESLRKHSGPYHADDEESAVPPRRFSDLYGHGRALESERSNGRSTTGRKRGRSISASESSPKKVRFNPDHDETREIQEGEVRSLPVSPVKVGPSAGSGNVTGPNEDTLAAVPSLTAGPGQILLQNLSSRPEILRLPSVADLFRSLQVETQEFAQKWFSFDKREAKALGGEHSSKLFPLGELEADYPALFYTVSNILETPAGDRRQAWLRFFTNPTRRQALVYGILGEWLTQRVFKDTSFGLDAKMKQKIRDEVEIKYLHYDTFVRVKERAEVIKGAFDKGEHRGTIVALEKAASELADEMMNLLAPLLPTWTKADPFGDSLSSIVAVQWRIKFRSDLIQLIKKAAGLNFSIVLSGKDGTLIRTASRLERGREFHPAAPMQCINLSEAEQSQSNLSGNKDEHKLMVKMTSWPRIEAYVPHGADQLEMERKEQSLLARELRNVTDAKGRSVKPTREDRERVHKKFCWDCAAPSTFEKLPGELCGEYTKREERRAMLRRAAKYDKRARKDHETTVSDDPIEHSDSSPESDDTGSDDFSSSEDELEVRTRKRKGKQPTGSWMTLFDCLVPHQVYCEWTNPIKDEAILKDQDADIDGKAYKERSTLRAAVHAARSRSSASPLYRLEDAMTRIWNFYASKNLSIEWLTLLAIALYLNKDKMSFNLVGTIDRLRTSFTASYESSGSVTTTLTDLMIPHQTKELVKAAFAPLANFIHEAHYPVEFGRQLVEKLKEIMPMPAPITEDWNTEASTGLDVGGAFAAAASSAVAGFWPIMRATVSPAQITTVPTSTPAIPLTGAGANLGPPTALCTIEPCAVDAWEPMITNDVEAMLEERRQHLREEKKKKKKGTGSWRKRVGL